ncbi:hypothetical protein BDF14DRAFT_1775163 [Spinellus fusiger]|nr:hypothetical protein BDF14DRAFT_1775163 [Spinellus fusiger]
MEYEYDKTEVLCLIALINKELDDFDLRNAAILAERLYAIDRTHEDYRFLYAKCHFLNGDFSATNKILKDSESIPCVNLFAKSCLLLGNVESCKEKQKQLWRAGIKRLTHVLDTLEEVPRVAYHWGDDLACVTTRSHMPNQATMYSLLGELYNKVNNTYGAVQSMRRCVEYNPYKLATFMKLCDLAPDIDDFDPLVVLQQVYSDFPETTIIVSQPQTVEFFPLHGKCTHEIKTQGNDTIPKGLSSNEILGLRRYPYNISLEKLRALVCEVPEISDEEFKTIQPEREEREICKEELIEHITKESEMKWRQEAFRTKNGLYHRHYEELKSSASIQVPLVKNELQESPLPLEDPTEPNTCKRRLSISDSDDGTYTYAEKRKKYNEHFNSPHQTQKNVNVEKIFYPNKYSDLPQSSPLLNHDLENTTKTIVEGMNQVLYVVRIIAEAYQHQSSYHCKETVLALHQLDDYQYESARVLCILGTVFYNDADYENAVMFFRHAFVLEPWFCEGIPIYSTCLWYLDKVSELNLLAYDIKANANHQYEAYIAAGNWAKCARTTVEARQMFNEAVSIDPSKSYAYYLLGHEEAGMGNWYKAGRHFGECMIKDRQSYHGWYGMATACYALQDFEEAGALLEEAIRLHPRQPVILTLMAEVQNALGNHGIAMEYIDASLSINPLQKTKDLKKSIEQQL